MIEKGADMIIITQKMVFVSDTEDSNKNIEYQRTEYIVNQHKIKIDRTFHPP